MAITVVLCCLVLDIATHLGLITTKENDFRVMKFTKEKLDYYKA